MRGHTAPLIGHTRRARVCANGQTAPGEANLPLTEFFCTTLVPGTSGSFKNE